MEVADKAVATDELCYEHNTCLEVARLEAVLNTLVERKVENMRGLSGGKFMAAVQASPRTLAKKLKAARNKPAADRNKSPYSKRKRRRLGNEGRGACSAVSRSPESARCNLVHPPPSIAATSAHDEELYLHFDPATGSCCCMDHTIPPDTRIPISHETDDYVSLKMDEYDEIEFEEDDYEARRRRRKRRKRRRKRRRLRALATVAVMEDVKVLDPDELPPKARWTIVATAGLLLFMCLMLVGVTLRMAPLIDDMVRKENEALMHHLHGNGTMPSVATTSAPQ